MSFGSHDVPNSMSNNSFFQNTHLMLLIPIRIIRSLKILQQCCVVHIKMNRICISRKKNYCNHGAFISIWQENVNRKKKWEWITENACLSDSFDMVSEAPSQCSWLGMAHYHVSLWGWLSLWYGMIWACNSLIIIYEQFSPTKFYCESQRDDNSVSRHRQTVEPRWAPTDKTCFRFHVRDRKL